MTELAFAFDYLVQEKVPKLTLLTKHIKRVDAIYHQAMTNQKEELANQSWLAKELLLLKKKYIQTFNKMKSGKFYDAWCALEQLEISYHYIEMNSQAVNLDSLGATYIIDTVKTWQKLYPYRYFGSPEFTVEYHTCTICQHKIGLRSRCEHEPGKLYNGKLCLHSVCGMKLLGLAIVKNPVQKYSVLAPEDKDYRQVKYVADRLKTPFSKCKVSFGHMEYARSKFNQIPENSMCPCRSDKEFKDCCWEKEFLTIPHVQLQFDDELPRHLRNEMLPY